MPGTLIDFEPYRGAKLALTLYGENAVMVATGIADQRLTLGDLQGYRLSIKVVEAIRHLSRGRQAPSSKQATAQSSRPMF